MLCKSCGKNIDQYAKVCFHCNQPTGFLKGLDGKEKLAPFAVLGTIHAMQASPADMPTVKKITCKQCGYLNDATHEVCALCGCELEPPVAPAPAPTVAAPAAAGAAAIAMPENKKKLFIGIACAAELILVLLIIILVSVFSGNSTAIQGGTSAVSLVYVSSAPSTTSVVSVPVQSLTNNTVSSGLDLNALLSSEELASQLAAQSSSNMSGVPSTPSTPIYILPYTPPANSYSPPAPSSSEEPSRPEPSRPASSHQTSSHSPSSSAPSSHAVSSKPTPSKPTPSRPVSSEQHSSEQPSEDSDSTVSIIVIPEG